MTEKERENLSEKICKALAIMSWEELAEHGVNAQQAIKIKNGEKVRFYAKTIERLRFLVT